MDQYTHLQLREVFHLEFLRWFGRKVKAGDYAVKGGVNLRLFFKSFRYSEDMDLDARGVKVIELKEIVMKILNASAFQNNLKPFGIMSIMPPDIRKAKQTETTQRFKIHLIASSGEDLFTKVEFSRRGFAGKIVTGAVDDAILRTYKLAPLLVPHYDVRSAIAQKMSALADRTAVQARDIFDIYLLSSQYIAGAGAWIDNIKFGVLSKAYERVFEVEFEQFRDTVVSYLSVEDQPVYDNPQTWEEIRLKVAHFIEEVRKSYA
ncbi:MAG: nucleotidyl transferase AbiEii/AbiGii toxin family protein [Candidatus Omnitrophica bacterium]|nr:nucleotidyl transferase AbiEii/AbiGii toxin family protein [Candidatus Omnitrophota bacterium]